ncbi:MAG: hypothetical protein WC102_01530 [Saccharofermentanales bacterium]
MIKYRVFMVTEFGEKKTVDYVNAEQIGQLNTNAVLINKEGRIFYIVPSNCGVQEETEV